MVTVRQNRYSVPVGLVGLRMSARIAANEITIRHDAKGHVDVRTTQIYVDVSDQRKNEGIAALERAPHPLAAATMAGSER